MSSYPDVVQNSSRNQSPQRRPVNVTQRSQGVTPAAMVESEAGIKRGHVNNIASLFGKQQQQHHHAGHHQQQQQQPPSTRGRAAVRPSNELVVVAVTHQQQHQAKPPPPSPQQQQQRATPQPIPWPSPSHGGQLKPVVRAAGVDSSGGAKDSATAQPTIVFNRTKYVPRASQSADRVADMSGIPTAVRVGRWSVYETLPLKDGAESNGGRRNLEEEEEEKEAERWRKREAAEMARMADAERRKAEYDRKHREELEAQERRRREELSAAAQVTERMRREESAREAEMERRRLALELEEREAREQERRREVERRENERRLRDREARERDEEERRRRSREEHEKRQLQEDSERRRREARLKEEQDARRRKEEEKRLRHSAADTYTAEEWTVYEKVPLASSEPQPYLRDASSYSSGVSNFAGGGYRRYLDGDPRDSVRGGGESEYERSLREIETDSRRRRRQDEEDAERKRRSEEAKQRDQDSAVKRPNRDVTFREGLGEWIALTDSEPLPSSSSGSALGYRRYLEDNPGGGSGVGGDRLEDDDRRRRQREQETAIEEARRREAADARRRQLEEDEENRRRDLEEHSRRREIEENRRRREEEARRREMEDRRRLEEERKSREEERRRRELEEDRRRRDEEERRSHRNMFDENERRMRYRWSNYDAEDRFPRSDGDSDAAAFSRVDWTVLESVPDKDAHGQDSIVGYRRLLEENAAQQPQDNSSRSLGYENRIHRSIRIGGGDDNDRKAIGGNRTQFVSTRVSHRGRPHSDAEGEEETTRFEEWTEYHQPSAATTGRDSGRRAVERRRSSGSVKEEPKFEEWTVVHRVPLTAALSQTATGSRRDYDVTDASPPDDGDDGGNGRRRLVVRRRSQSGDSLSLTDSEEQLTIEEIVPRRRDTGRRQRDVLVAAALRQLETPGPDATGRHHRGEETPSPTLDEDLLAVRTSPYHSYQRIHSRGGQQHHDNQPQRRQVDWTDNGNVFQDSFSVRRDNPTFAYWPE